jgi:hypothetical protein
MLGRPKSAWYRLRHVSTCAAVLALLGCVPWMSIPAPAPGVLPPDTHLQVWRGTRAVVLDEVTIEPDSIRGRVVDPLGARSTGGLVIPRAEVDSFQLRPRDNANWFGAGLAAGILGSIIVPYLLRRAAAGGT